jgi:hypothetical protein
MRSNVCVCVLCVRVCSSPFLVWVSLIMWAEAQRQAPSEILLCVTTALEEMCGEAGAHAAARRRRRATRPDPVPVAGPAAAEVSPPIDPMWVPSWEQTQAMNADSLLPIVIYCRAC